MSNAAAKSFTSPDEIRDIPKGRVEIVTLGDVVCAKVRYEPGFRWSECLKSTAGTDTCQFNHYGYVLSGRLRVRMENGTEAEVGPGDVFVVPAGHDGWVVGDEPFEAIDFSSDMKTYAG
jgi:mannose-6-phosphate isomerase-like protein (cupin superfamily)